MAAAPGHLIHIGYAKAGSTFLQEWFSSHPQLAYVEGGVAGYTDVWDIARASAQPQGRVAYRVTSGEALASPSVHAGLHHGRSDDRAIPADSQAAACAELASLFPDARILLVTRGFRSAYVSAYSQYVLTGGTGDFDPAGRGAPPGTLEAEWNYDGLIRMYEAAFPGRLIVLPYELLRDDPARFVAELQSELGLSEPGALPGRPNPSLSPAELRWYPRLSRLVESIPVRGRLRRRLLNGWTRHIGGRRASQLVGLLQRLDRGDLLEPADLTDELVASFRGRAESLRGHRLYAPYASDYLL
jgi:hypothetical protein